MPSQQDLPLSKRLVDAFAMFLVAVLSLVLLVYVAFGEAKRTYEQFQMEKLVAQGQVVQSAVESFVRPGLPIQQFVGFNQLTDPMVKNDPLLDGISFHDINGARVFAAGEPDQRLIDNPELVRKVSDGQVELRYRGDVIQVVLPVRSRFEQVGHVVLVVPRVKIAERVEAAFEPLVKIGLGASAAFALFVLLFTPRFAPTVRNRWVAGAFAVTFIGVAVVVVSTLITVYAQGAQARAKSLADSLGQRLDDVVVYNINFDDITGIVTLFGEYKRLNPDIRSAALIIDGRVRAHTDPTRRGGAWDHAPEDYEYAVTISPQNSVRHVEIRVALPRDIVVKQVSRSVKNFAALFVASAFFAALFMGLARSLQRLSISHEAGAWSAAEEKAVINLVKPAFFLAVFVEHLSYAFLPSMMKAAALSAGLSGGYASAPFMAYYLTFALALIPAARLETRIGAKSLMLLGLLFAGGGLFLMSTGPDFWMATGARAVAGLGQGIMFIGVQAYVLANSSPERRTQAGASIVFGFQAGMIAGMAIGSLLVSYLGSGGVFVLAAAISLVIALYVLIALPSRLTQAEPTVAATSALRDLVTMLRDGAFARSVFLVGVPAKAILTGVVLFALPLLLAQQGFAKEDIGQIIMIYAGGVLFASHFAAIRADRTANTERILFQGAAMTAAGLGLISLAAMINWQANAVTGVLVIIAGVTLIGFAHGFINAPVVTHVVGTRAAQTYGVTNAAAAYRLMERVGHVLGPIIMGQLFVVFDLSWSVLAWIAVAVFVMGAMFLSPHATADGEAETRRT